MTILDGKKTSEALKQEIAEEVKQLKNQGKKVPHLGNIKFRVFIRCCNCYIRSIF